MADLPKAPSKEDLTYNSYLQIPELLALQNPLSEPKHHDEMLFIIIHQAYELWFKLILDALDESVKSMKELKALKTQHSINRCVQIMKLLVQQIHILETMAPADFLQFRDRLNPASGFQSLQFRELEFFCGMKDERYFRFFKNRPEMMSVLEKRFSEPAITHYFFDMLRNLGHRLPESDLETLEWTGSTEERSPIINALRPIYSDRQNHLELYLLCESLIEFDEYLVLWRLHHVQVVERVIGAKMGTGGSSGVDYLASRAMQKCFKSLWDVRSALEKI